MSQWWHFCLINVIIYHAMVMVWIINITVDRAMTTVLYDKRDNMSYDTVTVLNCKRRCMSWYGDIYKKNKRHDTSCYSDGFKKVTSPYIILRWRIKKLNVTVCHAIMTVSKHKCYVMLHYSDGFDKTRHPLSCYCDAF